MAFYTIEILLMTPFTSKSIGFSAFFKAQPKTGVIKLLNIILIFLADLHSERNLSMLFPQQQKGQGLVEYAIILVFVAIVVIAVIRLLGPKIGNIFSTVNSSL